MYRRRNKVTVAAQSRNNQYGTTSHADAPVFPYSIVNVMIIVKEFETGVNVNGSMSMGQYHN